MDPQVRELICNLGAFVLQAYELRNDPNAFQLPEGFEVLAQIDINDDAPFLPILDLKNFGYIARSVERNEIVVALRGTEGFDEWVDDFLAWKVAFPYVQDSGQTEDGFTKLYGSLAATVAPAQRLASGAAGAGSPVSGRVVAVLAKFLIGFDGAVLISAHSLGSALATLLAFELAAHIPDLRDRLTTVTFASPMVGDEQFANSYNTVVPNTWRVFNAPDIVVSTFGAQTLLNFRHVGREVPINSANTTRQDEPCYHAMNTYLATFGCGVPIATNCAPP